MNARVAAVLTGSDDGWSAAGDQLYVDLDLGESNLPAGSRLAIGEAIVEVSATPHTGCAKFSARFGLDALRFVSTPNGRAMRLRGMNARVVRGGTVRVGGSHPQGVTAAARHGHPVARRAGRISRPLPGGAT